MAAAGIVFDISRASFHDGPGIRTVVFLKGCPLRCAWCHNPESQNYGPQLSYNKSKCIMCRRCECCPQNVHSFTDSEHIVEFSRCKINMKCIGACPTGALTVIGKEMNTDQLVYEIMKDKKYYDKSGGGLTISGGEPTAQGDFVLELLQRVKDQGVSTCMETCGFAKQETFIKILPFVDYFLFDYKLTDAARHSEYTGVSNEQILSNLELLYNNKAKIILRCPIITSVNDYLTHFKGIAEIAHKYPDILDIQLMAYNNWGISKSKNIGNSECFETLVPTSGMKEMWLTMLKELGCDKVKIG